jgi:tetratricopeptide (TPR) repeat protein
LKIMRIRGRKQRKELAAAIKRGQELLASQRRQEAVDFLREAVQRFPDDPEIRVLHASILLAVCPSDVAAEASRAVELGADDPLILVRAGQLLLGRGEVEAARSCAARAKSLVEPDFVLMSSLVNLEGLLAAIEGEDELAGEKLRAAWKSDPPFSSLAVDLVKFLANRDRQAEALEVIDDALEHAKEKAELERLRSEIVGDGASP